jgi:hypothetical protein
VYEHRPGIALKPRLPEPEGTAGRESEAPCSADPVVLLLCSDNRRTREGGKASVSGEQPATGVVNAPRGNHPG